MEHLQLRLTDCEHGKKSLIARLKHAISNVARGASTMKIPVQTGGGDPRLAAASKVFRYPTWSFTFQTRAYFCRVKNMPLVAVKKDRGSRRIFYCSRGFFWVLYLPSKANIFCSITGMFLTDSSRMKSLAFWLIISYPSPPPTLPAAIVQLAGNRPRFVREVSSSYKGVLM